MKKFFVLARYTPDFFEALIKDPSSEKIDWLRLKCLIIRGEFDFVYNTDFDVIKMLDKLTNIMMYAFKSPLRHQENKND